MFLVFDEVQRGIYKRSSAVSTAGEVISGDDNRTEMHIDGPLEIKGLMNIAWPMLLCARLKKDNSPRN